MEGPDGPLVNPALLLCFVWSLVGILIAIDIMRFIRQNEIVRGCPSMGN